MVYTTIASGTTGDVSIKANRGDTPIAAMAFATEPGKYAVSQGAYDGTNQWSIAGYDNTGVSTTASAVYAYTTRFISTANTLVAVGSALIAGGVTINVSNAGISDTQILMVLFFDKAGSAKTGTFQASGTKTITTGINQNIVISSAVHDNFSASAVADLQSVLGFAESGGTQVAHWRFSHDGQTTSNVLAYVAASAAAYGSKNSGVTSGRLTYDTFGATSFQSTDVDAIDSSVYVGYLALDMPNCHPYCGILTTPTSTGALNVTDPGFKVSSLLCLPNLVEATDTIESDATAEAYFVGTAPDNANAADSIGIGGYSQDNVSTTVTASEFYTGAVDDLVAVSPTETVAGGYFTSKPTGFQLTFSAVAAAGKKWPYLAFGDA
jgi:hypothetical protein